MSNAFTKGSEWRKWDLHVHTPVSYENHFSEWDTYIKKFKEKAVKHDIEVVGINDYFSVDGYEKQIDPIIFGTIRKPNNAYHELEPKWNNELTIGTLDWLNLGEMYSIAEWV